MSYLFADGGYFTHRLREWSETFTGGEPIDVDYARLFSGHGSYEKIFYYDALPARKKDEPTEQYEARLSQAETHHSKLRAVPGCHVFTGKTVEGARALRQKGVDVLLTVHMLTHVFRKNVKQVTLLAGDADFAPLVRALVLEGAYVKILYGRKSGSSDLLEAADTIEALRADRILECATEAFKAKYPPPEVTSVNSREIPELPDGWALVRTGTSSRGKVQLFSKAGRWLLIGPSPTQLGVFVQIVCKDETLVQLFAEDFGIQAAW